MVERGLREGAVFSEGSLFYMVDKVVGDDYESHRISKEEADGILKKEDAKAVLTEKKKPVTKTSTARKKTVKKA